MSTYDVSVTIEREWTVGEANRKVAVTVTGPSLNTLDQCRRVALDAVREIRDEDAREVP